MARNSVMNHNFSNVPKIDIPRSLFDRSHGYKTTYNSSQLIPFFVDEALPGDTFNLSHTIFSRLTTPIVPFMDNLYQDVQYFAVPLRLLWDNFQRFNGEQTTPNASTDYLIPQVVSPAGGFGEGSIFDYMGIPPKVAGLSISALFPRAYNLIYNEWYRDQNLQDSMPVHTGDGPDPVTDYAILGRGKRHDYFTSALPWPQKGPSVQIGQEPLRVYGNQNAMNLMSSSSLAHLGATSGILETRGQIDKLKTFAGTKTPLSNGINFPPIAEAGSNVFANGNDLGLTINSIREAFQLQKMFEKDARGGTRYTEIIQSHFGVTSPDARLQRPEYLGGSTKRVNVVPVQQTSATNETSPQGNLAGFGVLNDSSNGFTKSFTEHTIIMGIMSVRADLTYQQGINRMFSRKTRFDFYWPSLAHLGEQEILNKEIYAKGNADDEKIFGYQERYAEYRYKPSLITGKLRSDADQSLDVWHLSQNFTALPKLNKAFITENIPLARVLAVTTQPQFVADIFIQLKCARPMPTYSVPGQVDHF